MSTKEIYIIRHGETDYNKQGIIQGRTVDAPLNDRGRKQAEQFYAQYKHLNFAKVYTSSLQRTTESVLGFIQSGVAHEALAELDELSWGVYDGRLPHDKLKPGIKRIIRKWEAGHNDVKAFGGESPNEVRQRLATAWHYIVSDTLAKRVLVATHGRAMRILLCHVFNQPTEQMIRYGHHNLCVYRVDWDLDLKQPSLVIENDISHLRD